MNNFQPAGSAALTFAVTVTFVPDLIRWFFRFAHVVFGVALSL